ncbi:MAG: hypothetical protein AAGC53_01325 [Actinomycetota bacterium]
MLRRRRPPVVRRHDNGRSALVVRLHGYGADEAQMDSLMPVGLDVTIADPRAPHRVPPGFGWWLPDGNELAPTDAIDQAIDRVVALITATQVETGIPPAATALLGYSQGATLGLCVAAARPDVVGVVATGAGALPPDRHVVATDRPLDILVMNGTLDPIVTASWHDETIERLSAVGHRVAGRIDRVPHVVDQAQAEAAMDFLAVHLPKPARRQRAQAVQ